MPLFFRREELPSRRSATRLTILLERRCKLDRILRDLLQVHLVVFNGSVGGKLRLTVLEALPFIAIAVWIVVRWRQAQADRS